MATLDADPDATFDSLMAWLCLTFPSEVAAADDLLERLIASVGGVSPTRELRARADASVSPRLRLVSSSR